jgi:cold shock CspA family protein
MRVAGRLKNWMRTYGFLGIPGSDEDIFVHASEMFAATATPHSGMWFEFQVIDSPRQPGKRQAIRLKQLDAAQAEVEAAWASRDGGPVRFGQVAE